MAQQQRNSGLCAILPALIAGALIFLEPEPAYAYIAPALGLVSYLLGPVVAVVVVVGLILTWPLKVLWRRLKKPSAVSEDTSHEKD